MSPVVLKSIGVLSLPEAQPQFRERREALLESVGELNDQDRARCVQFLRGGTLVLAFMEQTRDVIAERFVVAGGSGIRSDGTYYWRQDAADYIEQHGIGVPDDFLRHCREQRWEARELTIAETNEVDGALACQLGLRVRGVETE
jgi:hypothetical protein